MNGSSVTLDKVNIEIEASAASAGKSITDLAETLSTLKNAVKGGFTNLSKLASSLGELKTASNELSTVSKNLSGLGDIKTALSGLSDIPTPRGLSKTIRSLEKLPEAFAKISTNSRVLDNITRVSNQLGDALSPLASKLGEIAQGYSAINQLADRYGVSVTKITRYAKQSTNHFKDLSKIVYGLKSGFDNASNASSKFYDKTIKNISKMNSKIKQIALSLLGTRTIFTATRKAVSEYMALDAELTWKVANNWRALGAQLAPLIEGITYLFKQFIRVIYSIILALTGIDLIARANEKAMKGWGKAAKDTLGNLQKFDDLNVVEFPKATGGGDDNKLIELDTIDLTPIMKIIEWVRRLKEEIKEAWNSGQWVGVGEVLADGLNGALRALNYDWVEDKFKHIAETFGDFLRAVVDNFDWSLFGEKLTRQMALIPTLLTTLINNIPWENIGIGLNKALETFDPAFVIDKFLGELDALAKGFITLLEQIDFKIVGKKLSDTIIEILSHFGDFIATIPWGDLGTKIREVIENIDWKGIWDKVVDILKQSLSGAASFIDNLFGKSGIGKLLAGGGAVAIGVKGASDVIGTFDKIKQKVDPVIESMELIGKGTLSTDTISAITGVGEPLLNVFAGISDGFGGLMGALGGSMPIILGVVGVVALLVKTFVDLYNNNEAFREKVDELVGLFKGTFKKVFEDVKVVLQRVIDIIKDLWHNVLEPLIDLLSDVLEPFIETLIDVLLYMWKNVISPIASFLGDVLVIAFDAVAIAIKGLSKVVEGIITVLKWLWNNILEPIAKFLIDNIVASIKTVADAVSDRIEKIKTTFSKVRTFLDDMWEAMKKGPKSFANFVIEKIEWLINKIISGFNWLIKQLNKVSFKVPDWVPAIGGKKMGFDIKEIASVTLPRLETGTNDIPQDGPYYLHAHESVVPKKYNPAMGGGTNEETNRRLDTLISILNDTDFTTIVNVGNELLYKKQQKYTQKMNDKYGVDVGY